MLPELCSLELESIIFTGMLLTGLDRLVLAAVLGPNNLFVGLKVLGL